jgi:hypothetical protein
VSSTSLGLTCKAFYPIHRSLHGKVSLFACEPLPHATRARKRDFSYPNDLNWDSGNLQLHHLLAPWMMNAGYVRHRYVQQSFVKARELEGMKRGLEGMGWPMDGKWRLR